MSESTNTDVRELLGDLDAGVFEEKLSRALSDVAAGIVDHIARELHEVLERPDAIEEWIDVVILALDGAWRAGHSPEEIATALSDKQARNEARRWPDWRKAEPGKAIEHIREDAE